MTGLDLLSARNLVKAITDADVADQRPAVRGQLADELRRLLDFCFENMGEDGDGKVDVRFAELAVRILDRIAKLWRLDAVEKAPDGVEETVAASTARQLDIVRAQIADLADRVS